MATNESYSFALPQTMAANYFNNRLLKYNTFQVFVDYFSERGTQFIPSRTFVTLTVNPFGPVTNSTVAKEDASSAEQGGPSADHGNVPTQSGILSISPSFRAFNASDKEHLAYSIVAFVGCGTLTVLGCEARITHFDESGRQNFKIEELSIIEQREPGAGFTKTTVNRVQLLKLSSSELAKVMGPADTNPELWNDNGGAPIAPDTQMIAREAYKAILNDSYAAPLYPQGGLFQLNNQSTLVQNFSLGIRKRYQDTLQSSSWCTSTSTSCNGCSSSSSSTSSLINISL